MFIVFYTQKIVVWDITLSPIVVAKKANFGNMKNVIKTSQKFGLGHKYIWWIVNGKHWENEGSSFFELAWETLTASVDPMH